MKLEKITREFIKTLTEPQKKRTSAYDSKGIVTRIEEGIAWVKLAGSKIETPLQMTISAEPGDEVQARIGNGTGWLTGNAKHPPTDDRTANRSYKVARSADQRAAEAQNAAEEAFKSAEDAAAAADSAQASATSAGEYASRALGNLATVQSVAETLAWITAHGTMTLTADLEPVPSHVYFVQDADGDYTVNGVNYSIVTEPNADDMATYYELSIDESLNNYVGTHLALTDEGLWLLPASSGMHKILIATGAGSTYTTAGIYIIDPSDDTVAMFTSNEARIGSSTGGHTSVSSVGLQIYSGSSGTTKIANLGYDLCRTIEGSFTNTPFFTLGTRDEDDDIGTYSFTAGVDNSTTDQYGYSLGAKHNNKGYASGALGYKNEVTEQQYEYNSDTHTNSTVGGGFASNALGAYTNANRAFQTVIGIANVVDEGDSGTYDTDSLTNLVQLSRGKYAFIIGNGLNRNPILGGLDSITRSNALTVDWDGNTTIAGTLTQSSDQRLKEHIDYLEEDAAEFVRKLKPAHYIKDGKNHVGFYAQEVDEADEWNCMVNEDANGYMTLGYTELIAPLVAYCQQLERRIERLEKGE